MKTLYILRHGQKDESKEYEDDYDVVLTKEGEEEIKALANIFKDKNIMPDSIISSPAIRASDSAQIFAQNLGYKENVTFNSAIYNAYLNELVELISYTYDNINSLVLVGHNPALSLLCVSLTGVKEKMKTATAIRIDFECDSWLDIDKSNAKFVELLKAK